MSSNWKEKASQWKVVRSRIKTYPYATCLSLDLSNMRLHELNLLQSFMWLSHLDLSNNMLNEAIFEAVASLPELLFLDISCNRITTIPQSVQKLSKLKELYLPGNPISMIEDIVVGIRNDSSNISYF